MITLSKNIQLQAISLNNHQKLVTLMHHIYPPAYKHLWKREDCSWYLHKVYNYNSFELELEEFSSESYFILFNDEIIGHLRLVFNTSFQDEQSYPSCYLQRLYLSEETQGIGIGTHILNWIENRAKSKKNNLIWLESMDTQTQSISFYQKQGFTKSSHKRLDFKLMHKECRGMYIFFKKLE